AHRLGIPACIGEQPLDSLRPALAQGLGHLPAIPPRDLSQQPRQVPAGPPPPLPPVGVGPQPPPSPPQPPPPPPHTPPGPLLPPPVPLLPRLPRPCSPLLFPPRKCPACAQYPSL